MTRPRVLVIDDAPIVLETFVGLLEGRVETALTVGEGLAKLEADPTLKIVLADLNMQGGGVPFLRTLRARFPDRAVIVLSGDASILEPALARELGIFATLEKGQSSFDEIERTIDEAGKDRAT